MENHVFIAVIFAAALHAGWNLVIKLVLDRLTTLLLLTLIQGLIGLLLLPVVGVPPVHVWPWVFASAILHTGYKLFLTKAYAHADLSQAYPLARGTAPLIVALFSIIVLDVGFTIYAVIAILSISFGILLMAFKGGEYGLMSGYALYYAIGTAAFTASYTLVDGIGAQISQNPSGFILSMVIIDAVLLSIIGFWRRGLSILPKQMRVWRSGAAAGAMSLGSYWIAIWAFTHAPIALVATLRETSILFAVLIGAFILREKISLWRWGSVAFIAAGVVLMKL